MRSLSSIEKLMWECICKKSYGIGGGFSNFSAYLSDFGKCNQADHMHTITDILLHSEEN